MKKFKKLTDSEMEIMKVIWKLGEPVTVSQMVTVFKEKDWKVQTVHTFLTRLVDKGILKSEKKGTTNYYTGAATEQEYYRLEAKNMLELMYNGSLESFLSALFGQEKSTAKEELEKIKEWFDAEDDNA